mgnify:CR=1 FL=1
MTYIVDICDTLYYSNTTYDFAGFFLRRRNRFRYWGFRLICSRKSPVFYGLIIISAITRRDIHKKLVLRLLNGYNRDVLYEIASQFYFGFLKGREIKAVHKMLQAAVETRAEICLVSATIDPVAQVIARELKVNYLSSVLQYTDDICQGYLQKDLTGIKENAVRERYAGKQLIVITDNYSDYILVQNAHKSFVVIHNKKEEEKWKKLNPILLYPDRL